MKPQTRYTFVVRQWFSLKSDFIMDYSRVELALQALFQQYVPISRAQGRRLSDVCAAVLLVGKCHLRHIARHMKHTTQQG